jgi:hypothetical protein
MVLLILGEQILYKLIVPYTTKKKVLSLPIHWDNSDKSCCIKHYGQV